MLGRRQVRLDDDTRKLRQVAYVLQTKQAGGAEAGLLAVGALPPAQVMAVHLASVRDEAPYVVAVICCVQAQGARQEDEP